MSQGIPDRIYLQIRDEDGEPSHWRTWSVVRTHDRDILYTQGDPERLRLLEAVAEALRTILDAYWADEGRLFETTEAGAKALAALEALDKKEQPWPTQNSYW